MTDPTTAIVSAGSKAAIRSAEGFLSKLLGPAAKEAGQLLLDKVRVYRLDNQLRMLKRAQEMISQAGIEPDAVPLRTLLPLLEGASLEGEPNLSEKWAALLASAAHPKRSSRVVPSFITILNQLSADEVRLLDSMSTEEPDEGQLHGQVWTDDGLADLGFTRERFSLIADNLCRLGICAGISKMNLREEESYFTSYYGREGLGLTHLGRAFVAACKPPTAS